MKGEQKSGVCGLFILGLGQPYVICNWYQIVFDLSRSCSKK